jgi:hypothetical protein
MGKFQNPFRLIPLLANNSDIELYFVGNYTLYQKVRIWYLKSKYSNLHFLNYVDSSILDEFIVEHINIGIVTLNRDFLAYCVPAKLYKFIELGVPILAFIPPSSASKIVNDNGFGWCFPNFKGLELDKLLSSLITNPNQILEVKNNISDNRFNYSMEITMELIISRIKSLDYVE